MKNEYPCKSQFYYMIKVGCKVVFISRTCLRDANVKIQIYKSQLSKQNIVKVQGMPQKSIRTLTIGQFGPRPLVNSDLFIMVNSDLIKYFSLVNSDLFHWSIRTFFIGQFGPYQESIRTFSIGHFGLTSCRFHQSS